MQGARARVEGVEAQLVDAGGGGESGETHGMIAPLDDDDAQNVLANFEVSDEVLKKSTAAARESRGLHSKTRRCT